VLKFVIYQDVERHYRWALYAGKGMALANGAEPFEALEACKEAIATIRHNAAEAVVEDHSAVVRPTC